MSSPVDQEYWPTLLEQLAERSLAELAQEFGVEPSALDAALAATTGDRPVQQEVWWPEVLREHERGSLRQLARRFGTNPRRLRRGLARCAVRVAGNAVADEGLADLEPFRGRLGKEPDRTLASEAGVTVEAIKGERRRLGIAPYRMKPDVEEWGGRPPAKREKPRPRRRWQDAPEPVVIRRAGAAPGAEPVAEERTQEAPVIHVVERQAPRLGALSRPASTDEADRSGIARGIGGRLPSLGGATEDDPDASMASRDQRRRRLVRPTSAEGESAPAGTDGLPRLARAAPRPPVRIIAPEENTVEDLASAVVPTPPRPRKAQRPPKASPVEVLPPEPEASEPEPPSPEPPAIEPPASEPQPSEPTPAPRPQEGGAYAWQVRIPGRPEPLLVLADDLDGALTIASRHAGVASIAGAKAVRVAEVLRDDS